MDWPRPVLVNLTADCCLTCKVNEQMALETTAAHRAFAAADVALLKGDWTRSDPRITAVPSRYGRSGVHLYLLFPPQGEPRILSQVLTPASLPRALEAMRAAG